MSKRKHRYTNVLAYMNFWDARGVSSLVKLYERATSSHD